MPQLLPFEPYDTNQLIAILTAKLDKLTSSDDKINAVVMPPKVIEFCARKVAAVTGDLRRAIDICM
jgi:cell division control protein 6